MLVALLLQTSLVARPMYLDDAPPELRTARHIVIADEPGGDAARARESTLRTAAEIESRLRDGAEFETIVRRHAGDDAARHGAILGTFARGMLAPELDRFLFGAEIEAVSAPIALERGVTILQRVETYAAVRQILVRGQDDAARKRAQSLLERVRGGGDFAAIAREHSEDAESAARGGQFAIYERGPRDTLLKATAFRLSVGETAGPIASPLGWHVIQRVAESAVDAALRENSFVRVRGILIRFDSAGGGALATNRNQAAAKALADAISERITTGEDMAALAAEFDEDIGGRERRGDLGWIYRHAASLPAALRQAALLPVGGTTAPSTSPVGYLILRRER
ncbi:MAG: peptidylprolyl isomerase [Planctomycetota bacterium]